MSQVFELEGEIAVNKLGEGENDIPPQYEQACAETASECPMEAITNEL